MDISIASESDHPRIVEFFERNNFALRRPEWFTWKHAEDPCGESFILVAQDQGEVLATIAVIPQWFEYLGNRYTRLQLADALVHPEWRGKHLSSRLLGIMLEERTAGRWGPAFFLGFPGPVQTRAASANRGMQVLAVSSSWTYVLDPKRFGAGGPKPRLLSAPVTLMRMAVTSQSGRDMEVRSLAGGELDLTGFRPSDRISGIRDARFIEWRITRNPMKPREVLGVFAEGTLLGYCVGAPAGVDWEIIEHRFLCRHREGLAAILRFLHRDRGAASVSVCSFEVGASEDLPRLRFPRGKNTTDVYVNGLEELNLPLDAALWAVSLVDSDW